MIGLRENAISASTTFQGLRTTGEPLRDGDSVIFFDRKDREYLKTLRAGETISIRGGTIAVDDLLGRPDGFSVRSSLRERFVVLRPTLERLIPNLPRKAQVIYPKDLGLILMWGDVYPGATVVEAGVGPGALTLALLRAVGREGRVISFETREEHARAAERNVARYYGAAPQWTLEVGDVADGLRNLTVDRIFLDLPEPWRQTDLAWSALRPGGLFLLDDWVRMPLSRYAQDRPRDRTESPERRRAGWLRMFPFHNKYTADDWKWLLAEAGFSLVSSVQIRPQSQIFVAVVRTPFDPA